MVFDNFFGDIEAQPGAALGLLGCEIRIEDSRELRRLNPSTRVFDAKIDIEIFLRADNRDFSFLVGGSLHRIDDHVLNSAADLHSVA